VKTWKKLAGLTAIAQEAHKKVVKNYLTNKESSTWQEMFGNGVKIGLIMAILVTLLTVTPEGQAQAFFVWFVVAAGTTRMLYAVLPPVSIATLISKMNMHTDMTMEVFGWFFPNK
jgi:hypothetical protein